MEVTLSTTGDSTSLTGTVTVSADMLPTGTVTSADLYVDDVLQGSATSAPFTWAWDTLLIGDGAHNLKVRAFYPRRKVAEGKLSVAVLNFPAPSILVEAQEEPLIEDAPVLIT